MAETIITIGAVFGALGVIGGFFYAIHKVLKRFENLEIETSKRKEDNQIIISSLFCTLDGLKQLGANGKVSKKHEELQEYIIKN